VRVDLVQKTVDIDHDDRFVLGDWKSEIESLNPDYKVHPLS
jgi:hypothetical protein